MTDETRSGLDYVESSTDSGKKDETGGEAIVKAQPIKIGKSLTLPAVSGVSAIDQDTIENLKKELLLRENQRNSFIERLKDAQAWLSGGIYGPTQGLAQRGQERSEQAAEIFGMKNAIAQYQAAQENQRRFEKMRESAVGATPTASIPTADNLTPSAAPGAAPAAGTSLFDKYKVPGPTREALKNARTEEEWKKIWNNFANEYSKGQFSPERSKLVDVTINGKTYQKPLWWVDEHPELFTEDTGNKVSAPTVSGGVSDKNIAKVESGGNAAAVSPKGAAGVMQVMPNTLKDPGFGVTPAKDESPAELERVGKDYYAAMQKRYGNDTLAAIAYNMGPNKADEWIKSGADFNKLPQETKDYIGKVHIASAMESRQPAVSTAAPVAPKPVMKSTSKEEAAAAGKALEAEAGETGKTYGIRGQEVEKNWETAGTNLVRAEKIGTLADRNKEVLGVFVKPGVLSMVGTGLKEGIKVGPHGQLALPALEEMTAQMSKGATGTKLQERRDLAQTLHEVELDLSKLLKGQGTVSDAERRILAGIAGSVSDPADLLRKKALVLKLHAEYDKDLGNAYRKSGLPYSQFVKSDAFADVVTKQQDKLMQNFKNEYLNGKDIDYDETQGPKTGGGSNRRKELLKKWG